VVEFLFPDERIVFPPWGTKVALSVFFAFDPLDQGRG